jgi:hypothetical protein
MEDEDGISQPGVVENSIRTGTILDTQFLSTGRNQRHWSRERHRELSAFLQIEDGLAEFPSHVFWKLSDGVPNFRVKYGELHLTSVSDMGHIVENLEPLAN